MLWPWKSQIKIVLGPRTPPLRLIEIWCRCLAIVPRNWLLPCRFHHPSNWTQTRFSVAKTKRKKKQKNKTSGNNISCNTHVSCKQPDVRIVNDKQRPLIHGPVIRAKKRKKICMITHTHSQRDTCINSSQIGQSLSKAKSQYYISSWLCFPFYNLL